MKNKSIKNNKVYFIIILIIYIYLKNIENINLEKKEMENWWTGATNYIIKTLLFQSKNLQILDLGYHPFFLFGLFLIPFFFVFYSYFFFTFCSFHPH